MKRASANVDKYNLIMQPHSLKGTLHHCLVDPAPQLGCLAPIFCGMRQHADHWTHFQGAETGAGDEPL
jgi:hypothetical protein